MAEREPPKGLRHPAFILNMNGSKKNGPKPLEIRDTSTSKNTMRSRAPQDARSGSVQSSSRGRMSEHERLNDSDPSRTWTSDGETPENQDQSSRGAEMSDSEVLEGFDQLLRRAEMSDSKIEEDLDQLLRRAKRSDRKMLELLNQLSQMSDRKAPEKSDRPSRRAKMSDRIPPLGFIIIAIFFFSMELFQIDRPNSSNGGVPQFPFANASYKAQDNHSHQQIEFVDFIGCSPEQKEVLIQDRIDGQHLALTSLVAVNSTLAAASPDPESYVKAGGTFTIDWTTRAAKEHWGRFAWDPKAEAERTKILTEVWKASGTYPLPPMSSHEPSSMRHVSIRCPEENNPSCENVIAYERHVGMPTLNLCPLYFQYLTHDVAVSGLKHIPALQSSVKIIHASRAWVMLHENLHIEQGPAKQCENAIRPNRGCVNYVYESGRAKLLAVTDPLTATANNDNYASFISANFMEKITGRYPEFSSAWKATETDSVNQLHAWDEAGHVSVHTGQNMRFRVVRNVYATTYLNHFEDRNRGSKT